MLGVCNSIFSYDKVALESILLFGTNYISNNWHFLTSSTPPPPDNDICTGATELELIDCNYFEQYWQSEDATPDPEATGNCISNTVPAVWYTFTTPDPLTFSAIFVGASNINVEMFSSLSDCSNLVYEDCSIGNNPLDIEPATTYYLLVTGTLFTLQIPGANPNICDDPYSSLYFEDNPAEIWSNTDCAYASSIVPCENDHVVWYTYTTSCGISDILIDIVDAPIIWGTTADEISISVFYGDCLTLLSDYDVNGSGYVCSGIGNDESIVLENLPPNTVLNIAFGSAYGNSGYFGIYLEDTNDNDVVSNDICSDALPLTDGTNIDLTNICATFSGYLIDPVIQNCEFNSEATVWYEFDAGSEPHDITINLNSNGISNPGIAVLDECFGNTLAGLCGTLIELYCIDHPILIEVGSTLEETGEFDLEITSSLSSLNILNDICDDAILITDGLNSELTNQCASFSGSPTDAIIEGCFFQSEATVWYEYDPGSELQDIVVNLISSGVIAPALSAYDGCIGEILSATCGTSLEVLCIDSPIMIEVGSSIDNSGTFDLEISSSPSASVISPEIMADNICSNTEAGITIDIPGGELVNIMVGISSASSSSITGMTNHTFNGINSATINDVLVNTTTTAQEAIYTILIEPVGDLCPIDPIEISIMIYPGFTVSEISVDGCSPFLINLNASEIIEGGSPPFVSISWYWDVTSLIGTGNMLSFETSISGIITLVVVDSEGCEQSTDINVFISPAITPTFDFPLEYCRSEQAIIFFPETSIENIEGTWNIPFMDLAVYPIDGLYDIIFTPNDINCSTPITITIEIFSGDVLEFDLPSVLCDEEGEYIFPTEDINGIPGTWDIPSIDLSTNSGVQINSFSPSNASCFAIYEHIFVIETNLESTFGQPEALCRNDTPFTLNNISIEGYEGSWDTPVIDPSLVSGDSFTSTWIPSAGQSSCIINTSITVQIVDPTQPDFDLPSELCTTDMSFTFPTDDNQSITGTWSIPTIDPSVANGSIQSIFTSDEFCVDTFTWEIVIVEPLIPEFDLNTELCALDASITLPLVSNNSITGNWSLPTIDPSMFAGEQVTVEFQGETSGPCVQPIEITFNVLEAQDPSFALPERICWTDQDLLLPTNSDNGIEGEWDPSIINVQANPGVIISSTFTPTDGSCSNEAIHSFEILSPYDVEAILTNPSDCVLEDGTIQIDVIQGTNLEFSIDGGANWQSSTLFGSLSSGGYTILVRSGDFTTCELSLDAFLNSTDGPVINNIISTDIESCVVDNGSIIINADGNNLEYSIDDGATWQTSNEFNNLAAGDYSISIREGTSDCIVEANAMIADFPNTEILDVNLQDISDCNETDGQIEIIADGEALEYSIDNGMNWSTDNIFNNLSNGVYNVIVQSTEAEDCSETMMVEIIAPNQPTIIELESQLPSLCMPTTGSIEVQAEGNNLEYSIDGGVTWQSENIFNNLVSNEYQLIVRDSERINCFAESSISIVADLDSLGESTFVLTPPSECDLVDGILEVINSNPNVEFSIDGGNTWQLDNQFNNLSSGNYLLITRKVDLPECLVEQAIEVPNIDCPCNDLILEFVTSNILCDEEDSATIELVSTQGMMNPSIDILWQDGTQGQSIEGVGEGWHFLTITYDEHCEWFDSVFVDMSTPIEFDLIAEDLNCLESMDGMIQIVNITGGNGFYSYSIDGEEYQTENVFTNLVEGIYEVSVLDDNNCFALNNVEVTIQPNLLIELPEIVIITFGESIVLDPEIDLSQIDSFKWTSSDGTINSTDLILEVSPKIKTSYSLEIFYEGCYDQKEIIIEVRREEEIHIGNIFSPNGDNINDFIYIQGSSNSTLELNNYSIFDRWGNLLHNKVNPEFNNKTDGWDGYFHGKLVNDGVYIYLINYVRDGEEELLMGTVTLVRN